MALKNDIEFEGKPTCASKNDMRKLAIFHQSTKSQNWDFDDILFSLKLKTYELKICMGVFCHDNEEWWNIWRGTDLSVQNQHEEFEKFWSEHLKISKIFFLIDCFWTKHIKFELKKVQRSYVWWHQISMQILKENWLALSKMTWEI